MLPRYISLAIFLLLVIVASTISGMFHAGEWYHVIANKPSWTVPAWFYGPLWAVLYLLMALAAWNVWLTGHFSRKGALIWWGFLLLLNIIWPMLIFGLERPGWAWLVLGVTIGAAALCIRAFRLLSRQSAYLMAPYMAWLVFAWVWNLAVWTMNGGLFSKVLL